MKKINKHLNRLINYIEKLNKILYLINMNLNIYVISLSSIWMNQKLNLFYKHEHRNNSNFFSNNKLKFNL